MLDVRTGLLQRKDCQPKTWGLFPVIGPHTRRPSLSLGSLQKVPSSPACPEWGSRGLSPSQATVPLPPGAQRLALFWSKNWAYHQWALLEHTPPLSGAFSEAKSLFLFKINSILVTSFVWPLVFSFNFTDVHTHTPYLCTLHACVVTTHCGESAPALCDCRQRLPGALPRPWCPLNSAPGAFCPCWFCFVPVTVINLSYGHNSVQNYARSSRDSQDWRGAWVAPAYFSSFSLLMPLSLCGFWSCVLFSLPVNINESYFTVLIRITLTP